MDTTHNCKILLLSEAQLLNCIVCSAGFPDELCGVAGVSPYRGFDGPDEYLKTVGRQERSTWPLRSSISLVRSFMVAIALTDVAANQEQEGKGQQLPTRSKSTWYRESG